MSDTIINAAISKAYLDMCQTIQFRLGTSYLEQKSNDQTINETKKSFKKLKEDFKGDIENLILKYITQYNYCNSEISYPSEFLNLNPTDFDKWHFALTHEMLKIAESEKYKDLLKRGKHFTCGHAQKWINMTLKYMRIMGIDKFDDTDLHVPLDDYILAAISRVDGIGLGIDIDKPVNWSGITDYINYYQNYQLRIREKLKDAADTPIAWESKTWQAENASR